MEAPETMSKLLPELIKTMNPKDLALLLEMAPRLALISDTPQTPVDSETEFRLSFFFKNAGKIEHLAKMRDEYSLWALARILGLADHEFDNCNQVAYYLSKYVIPEVSDLSNNISLEHTVNVAGILLDKSGKSSQSDFLLTNSSYKVMHEIALAISSNEPVLLQGLAGVGKTAIIEELCRLANPYGSFC
jgi:ABC-type glutathione transport system ATPase component